MVNASTLMRKYVSMKDKVATTVKVENALYDEFKILGVRYKLTLQGLVEKTVFRYVREEVFRNDMNSFSFVSSSALVTTSSLA